LPGDTLADGGGAFVISTATRNARCRIRIPFYSSNRADNVIAALTARLGGQQQIRKDCGLILAGIPAAMSQEGEEQLREFLSQTKTSAPVIRYRNLTGEFASASSVAAVTGVSLLETGRVPGALINDTDRPLAGKNILILGLGKYLSAMELASR
jgi:3-oxoacyl-[acyl-carrier-protein] synthase-1/3-oxoacyl-[acyl-carrier-protein] synthase II